MYCWEHFGAHFGHFGAVLSPQMEPKSTWGHLWGPVAPPGSPQWGSGGILGFILEFILIKNQTPQTCKSKGRLGLRFGSMLVDVGMHVGVVFDTFGTLEVEKLRSGKTRK